MAEASGPGTPTVIVSHLDVHYTVFGGGRRGVPSGQGTPTSFTDRLRRHRPTPKVRQIHAVKDVSFVARHGESIGIIGRNGSGKSTLLRAVAGLIPPSSGRLWVSGEPSLLGVNAVLMSKLSGERNIYIGAQALGLSKAEIAERFDEIVEFSGIGDAVYRPMSTYSSGMGARLRFAISTAATPDVLMIDEALATGDADFRHKSAERIARIREQAGTVFLVSHSNGSIRQICDRVLWMDQGRLIMDGPTEEVLPQYEATLPQKKRKKVVEPADPAVPGTVRHGGRDRLDVAAAVTHNFWSSGVDGAFVVSTHRLAAARAVTPVAARLGWPLLWVRPGAVHTATRNELERLRPQRLVVVGGEGLISSETYETLESLAVGSIERLGSDDSAVTSAALVREFPPTDTTHLHVTLPHSAGSAPAVSLAAAVRGQAVFLLDASSCPDTAYEALQDLAPSVITFHGAEEDWSADVLDRVRQATGARVEFEATGGPMALAAGLWEDTAPGGRILVTGQSALEVLTASVAAVHAGIPLLLTTADRLPGRVRKTIERLAPREIVIAATVTGLPAPIRERLGTLVGGRSDSSSG
ncbi:ATP-binding cassette domain-containing protein [Janibacter anophelis]|uniref:ATP-binding cassette domain-containing protein n=1 Tax=Janibacter anophelis TaxID=319054 RepID=UPI000A9CFCED|nr:ATP-binding cassette domain-containing protein [Janibacter anophelis]